VFVYAVSLEIKHNLSDDMTMNSMQIDLQSIVLSLLLLQVFSSEATLLNYPLWSLSAEWIVNVVMAILAVILSRSFYIYILIVFLLLGIISASSPSDPEWVNQICRAGFGISLGMLIRHFFDQGINLQAQKLHLTLSSISSLIVVFLKIDFGSFQSIFSCLVFTYLIYSVANFEVEKNIRVPESLARNCGIYSFGLYVWHVPLSGLVNRLLEVVQLNDLGIFYLVLVATSSMATLISVNYIESPILQKLEVRLKTK
jgi:peptidoglycan/LPS O-acetylase OafA/YrhL